MDRYGELETRRADAAGRKSIHGRRRRPSPFWLLMTVAALAAFGFLGWSVFNRDTPVSVLAASLVVVGGVLGLVTLGAAVSTYRAGADGSSARAFMLAIIGGIAAIGAAIAFASAYALASLLGS